MASGGAEPGTVVLGPTVSDPEKDRTSTPDHSTSVTGWRNTPSEQGEGSASLENSGGDKLARQLSELRKEVEQEAADTKAEKTSLVPMLARGSALMFSLLIVPFLCRRAGLNSAERCALLILSVLGLNICDVMPLFCTALLIPVLGTLCEVLGDGRSTLETSTLLVGNVFNNVSFMVLGALVINGIFEKCQLGHRLTRFLAVRFPVDGCIFLLLLTLGSMAICSVLYSGSLMILAAVRPLTLSGKRELSPNVVKRMMISIAFASNAGSTWLPISSPVNLIAVSLLDEFDQKISVPVWSFIAIPTATLCMVGLWLLLLCIFPATAVKRSEVSASPRGGPSESLADEILGQVETKELTRSHWVFVGVALLAILGMTAMATELEPFIGHPACISIGVVVLAFGSGFMTRDEFLTLDWDLLALVGGTNVMAFLVRETGLGAELSALLVKSPIFTSLPYWGILSVIIGGTLLVTTVVGHTLTGVLLLPLVVALGVKLQAAQTTALLCAIAIPFGMGMPFSSFDNMAAYSMSRGLKRPTAELNQRDFVKTGGPLTLVAFAVIMLVGFHLSVQQYGLPPPVIVAETGTPEDLKPKIVKENLPDEATQITYTEDMGKWKEFESKPDFKAFAVGELSEGMRTRPWGATWGHPTQEDADRMAMAQCEEGRDTQCRLIYPAGEAALQPGGTVNQTQKNEELETAVFADVGHKSRRMPPQHMLRRQAMDLRTEWHRN